MMDLSAQSLVQIIIWMLVAGSCTRGEAIALCFGWIVFYFCVWGI